MGSVILALRRHRRAESAWILPTWAGTALPAALPCCQHSPAVVPRLPITVGGENQKPDKLLGKSQKLQETRLVDAKREAGEHPS